VGIDRERFELLVEEAVASLPEWVMETLDNVEILTEDEPPPGQHLFGLYEGVPLASRGNHYSWVLPDRITLFVHPMLRATGNDEDALRALVRHTVVHEIGHHFGISDERLVELDAY
jgi:predicted Zn-dependent protease with MMP-like domain